MPLLLRSVFDNGQQNEHRRESQNAFTFLVLFKVWAFFQWGWINCDKPWAALYYESCFDVNLLLCIAALSWKNKKIKIIEGSFSYWISYNMCSSLDNKPVNSTYMSTYTFFLQKRGRDRLTELVINRGLNLIWLGNRVPSFNWTENIFPVGTRLRIVYVQSSGKS